MATVKVKVEGLRELEVALRELPKATGKGVLRRVLKARAQPIADAASANATRRTGSLAGSAAVSTKLGKRQRGLHRKMFKNDKASVEMFAGFGVLPHAHLEEFGSVKNEPQPMLRPAWDENKGDLLEGIAADLATEIDKAAQRLARKRARQAAG